MQTSRPAHISWGTELRDHMGAPGSCAAHFLFHIWLHPTPCGFSRQLLDPGCSQSDEYGEETYAHPRSNLRAILVGKFRVLSTGGRSSKMGKVAHRWSCIIYPCPIYSSLTERWAAGGWAVQARPQGSVPGTKGSNEPGGGWRWSSQTGPACMASKTSKPPCVTPEQRLISYSEAHLTVWKVLPLFANANMHSVGGGIGELACWREYMLGLREKTVLKKSVWSILFSC